MTVYNKYLFYDHMQQDNSQRGSSTLEVLLSIAIILIVSPFLYSQIIDVTHNIQDISVANKIVNIKDGAVNFLRVNYTNWPDEAELQMDTKQLAEVSTDARVGFIDKYKASTTTIVDMYLAFSFDNKQLRVSNIAKHIGQDAAIVMDDGVAYSASWAVSAPDFKTGDLIYKISKDFSEQDKSKYLHRATMGEDNLNVMHRDLYMNGFDLLDSGNISSVSANIVSANTSFIESDLIDAETVYFAGGANMNANDVAIGSLRVTDDINGFKNIVVDSINGNTFSTKGYVIADSVKVNNSVNVSGDMILKSDSAKTISGFSGVKANSVATSFLSATDIMFYENYGLTVSGELLLSSVAPLKVGNWVFPTTTPPKFTVFKLNRASITNVPNANEYKKLIDKDWNMN
ncbi:MAG: hypothetical protein MJ156_01030 [Alphaproteobacteria bacterium]|nr:hypothetical protein [Alphaproteobacteria bacterium]